MRCKFACVVRVSAAIVSSESDVPVCFGVSAVWMAGSEVEGWRQWLSLQQLGSSMWQLQRRKFPSGSYLLHLHHLIQPGRCPTSWDLVSDLGQDVAPGKNSVLVTSAAFRLEMPSPVWVCCCFCNNCTARQSQRSSAWLTFVHFHSHQFMHDYFTCVFIIALFKILRKIL